MNTTKKRIFICDIQQESNCFNPIPSPKEMFYTLEGERSKAATHFSSSAGGFRTRLLEEQDVELIFGTYMGAPSGAPLKTEVCEYFLDTVLPAIKNAGKLDGIALSLHGATMAENSDDVCGDVIEAIRNTVGEEMPISAAFDFHANITEKIMKNADYVCGYLEYPHIDQVETGVRAAELLIRHLNGKPAKMARVTIPMIAPAHAYTTKEGGLLALENKGHEMVKSGRILDYTIFEVQPWLDNPQMASSIIVIADDEETAKSVASELAFDNFNIRKELLGSPLTSIEEVIQKALENKTGKPIILVDSSDSRGAGSTADSAAVLEYLLPYKDKLKCALGVTDAEAVKKAFEIGVGASADFTLGASIAKELSKPVKVENATVKSLHNGYFSNLGPIARGGINYCGKVAVLQVGSISIQVSTDSRREGDRGFFVGFGIIPELCDIVSVKACTSFRAGYTDIAAEICNTATPGAAGTVLTDLPYKRRPVPMYPFEEITEADISEPKCFR